MKRVGVALSDPLGISASPLTVLATSKAVLEIRQLCSEHEVEVVVVGLPTGLKGNDTPSTVMARELAAEIEAACDVETVLVDERFTSTLAENALLEAGLKRDQRKNKRDMVAAALILQSYLDRT